MTHIKTHLFSLIISMLSLPVFSQSVQLDSLLLEINKKQGKEKLEAILLTNSTLRGGPDFFSLSNIFEQEAKKQSNLKYIGYAYRDKAYHYLAKSDNDSVQHYTNQAKKIFTEISYEEGLQAIDFVLIAWYMAQGNNELVIYKIQEFLDNTNQENRRFIPSLYNTMGIAYLASSKPIEAIKSLNEGLRIMRQEKEQYEAVKTNIYHLLSESYRATKEYDKALAYCDSMKTNIETNMTYLAPSRMRRQRSSAAAAYAAVYIDQNNLQKAKESIVEAENYLGTDSYAYTTLRLNEIKAEYYFKLQDYTLALHYQDLCINDDANNLSFKNAKLLIFRSKILVKLERLAEAYEVRDCAEQLMDSISQQNMNIQFTEIQTIHQTKELKAQVENDSIKLQAKQKTIIILAILGIFLATIIVFIIFTISLQDKKNRILIEQLKRRDPRTKYLRRKEQDGAETLSPELKLFNIIDEHVQKTECFKDPEVNRDSLSATLGTNRQYLTDAIKKGTGMTLNEYINSYRLEYCSEQLLEYEDESIKNIYTEAGFISEATFYRQFVSKYGMPPQKFKDLSNEMDAQ